MEDPVRKTLLVPIIHRRNFFPCSSVFSPATIHNGSATSTVARGTCVMLRILGSPKKLCNGWTRREMLVAGGLGLFGLGLSDYFRLAEAQAGESTPSPGNSFG